MSASAFDKAAELVGRRAHFRAELRRKLDARGFESGEIEAALDRLAGLGLLDDRALAVSEVERLRERKRLGRPALAAELERKGADPAAIDAALDVLPDDDEETARAAAERWLRTHAPERGALARHLSRKGYAGHVIFRVLNDLAPDPQGGDEAG